MSSLRGLRNTRSWNKRDVAVLAARNGSMSSPRVYSASNACGVWLDALASDGVLEEPPQPPYDSGWRTYPGRVIFLDLTRTFSILSKNATENRPKTHYKYSRLGSNFVRSSDTGPDNPPGIEPLVKLPE